MEKPLDFKSVYECNCYLGCDTLHPQVSIIDLEKRLCGQEVVKFEFYAVLLMEECPDSCCGREYDDYTNATMVFLKPGETFRLSENDMLPRKGVLLAFHPDLLFHTSLKSRIRNYTFFSYNREEALHLSQRETERVTGCLQNMTDELHHPIDAHSGTILSCQIELLLDYCKRYYERQFITRENRNQLLLGRLESLLDDFFRSGDMRQGEMPPARLFADQLRLSVFYLADMLKFETGKTWDEYCQLRRWDVAKNLLSQAGLTAEGVARRLGFPDVQHFTLLFKKITGMTPQDYRCLSN